MKGGGGCRQKGREVVKNQEVTGGITARGKNPTVIQSMALRHSGLSKGWTKLAKTNSDQGDSSRSPPSSSSSSFSSVTSSFPASSSSRSSIHAASPAASSQNNQLITLALIASAIERSPRHHGNSSSAFTPSPTRPRPTPSISSPSQLQRSTSVCKRKQNKVFPRHLTSGFCPPFFFSLTVS